MPAYNAAQTLRNTYDEVMAQGIVDLVIIVDDASRDDTVAIAGSLPNTLVHTHPSNRGYGGNQKTCYKLALENDADIIIMVHPDYQYTPRLIPAMASMVGNELYHCVLGSRILGGYALKGEMPLWKYLANRFLTLTENILTGAKLSEYHTGYRAFSRTLLEKLPLEANSGTDSLVRLHDSRGKLSDQIPSRGLHDKSASQHKVRPWVSGDRSCFSPGKRPWVSGDRSCFSPGKNGPRQIEIVS